MRRKIRPHPHSAPRTPKPHLPYFRIVHKPATNPHNVTCVVRTLVVPTVLVVVTVFVGTNSLVVVLCFRREGNHFHFRCKMWQVFGIQKRLTNDFSTQNSFDSFWWWIWTQFWSDWQPSWVWSECRCRYRFYTSFQCNRELRKTRQEICIVPIFFLKWNISMRLQILLRKTSGIIRNWRGSMIATHVSFGLLQKCQMDYHHFLLTLRSSFFRLCHLQPIASEFLADMSWMIGSRRSGITASNADKRLTLPNQIPKKRRLMNEWMQNEKY